MKILFYRLFKKLINLFWLFFSYISCFNNNIFKCKINSFCKFNGKEIFGNNVNFNGCSIYGSGTVTFGSNFHSAKGLIILTSYHNYKGDKIPYDESVISKNVHIGDNVWIGLNVTLLGGISIGEGAIIQAGSVVTQNIPELSIAGGNPARVFKYRDRDHYYRLKELKQFL